MFSQKIKASILLEATDLNKYTIKFQENQRLQNKGKTAFCTQYGHFKYQVMLFRLSNTLPSFQNYINKILAKKLDIFLIVYQDDILIYTEDLGQGYVKAVSVDFIKIKFVF